MRCWVANKNGAFFFPPECQTTYDREAGIKYQKNKYTLFLPGVQTHKWLGFKSFRVHKKSWSIKIDAGD